MNKIQQFFESLYGKKIVFCGLGGSHMPLIELFKKKGIAISACDIRDRETVGEVADNLEKSGVQLFLGDNYLDCIKDADVIFRTPGMYYHLPELEEARKNGVVVTSEIEVFFDLCPGKTIAITGSDGKTTTTSIVSEMLKAAGKKVYLGGNIGNPLLQEVENIKFDDMVVVELSSFQLISMRKSPDIAVVTNIAPNHLDVHKDMTEYIEAKKNIILHQNAFSRAVLNLDNEITNTFKDFTRGETLLFSRQEKCENGAYVEGNKIYMNYKGEPTYVMDTHDIQIPGLHNLENFLAAVTALWGIVDISAMKKVAREFVGVEHRAEFVREFDGVKYYNDSIASSPTRTICGTLSIYPQKIILISGGYDKKIPFDNLGPVIVQKVKTLILMGQTANLIEQSVKNSSSYIEGSPEIRRVQNMEQAVMLAKDIAVAGDVVSLSPSCASFDLYKNFAERGDHFKELVNRF